jgi:hypothetical protein
VTKTVRIENADMGVVHGVIVKPQDRDPVTGEWLDVLQPQVLEHPTQQATVHVTATRRYVIEQS